MRGLAQRSLPALRAPRLAPRHSSPALLLDSFPFEQAGIGLKYWDLHGLLFIPTALLLTVGSPALLRPDGLSPLTRTACYAYIAFITCIAVAQAFVWDSVGAQIGIWQFNPEKCTGLGGTLLPVEEILWLFHHVVKAALWQLKVADFAVTDATSAPAPMPQWLRDGGNGALAALTLGGVLALTGDQDHVKCVGLVAAFFAPVLAIVWNLGSRYVASHWRLFLLGWILPGMWTVAIDCLGQQQGVWYFPGQYLSGIEVEQLWLKLDIASVYLTSTFAVTATGAIILAAADELNASLADEPAGRTAAPSMAAAASAAGEDAPAQPPVLSIAERFGFSPAPGIERADKVQVSYRPRTSEPTLVDLGLFIFDNAYPGFAAAATAAAPSLLAPSTEAAGEAGRGGRRRDVV